MLSLLVIPTMAILNRIRGGGFGGDKLPGRALLWVAPVCGALAALLHSWEIAVTFTAGFLLWGLGPWGYLQLLGRAVDGKSPTAMEKLLLRAAFGNVYGAFFLRHLFILPLTMGLAYILATPSMLIIAPVFAAGAVISYELAWRLRPAAPILWGELAAGAMWGGIIVGLS